MSLPETPAHLQVMTTSLGAAARAAAEAGFVDHRRGDIDRRGDHRAFNRPDGVAFGVAGAALIGRAYPGGDHRALVVVAERVFPLGRGGDRGPVTQPGAGDRRWIAGPGSVRDAHLRSDLRRAARLGRGGVHWRAAGAVRTRSGNRQVAARVNGVGDRVGDILLGFGTADVDRHVVGPDIEMDGARLSRRGVDLEHSARLAPGARLEDPDAPDFVGEVVFEKDLEHAAHFRALPVSCIGL
jgi:hypothetical protein